MSERLSLPAARAAGLALAFAGVILGGAAPVHAQGPALGGFVSGFAFQELAAPWELDRVGTRLQLAVRGASGTHVSYYGAVDLELDSRLLDRSEPLRRGQGLDVYPVEAWVLLSWGDVDLKLGQQFIFWGRTTWVNPTDVITPWDYPDMSSQIEDYRLAPAAARLQWYATDALSLDLVWVPVFRASRLGVTAPSAVAGVPVTELSPALPSPRPDHGEVGLRLTHSVSSWALDWSVSAFRGYEKMPSFVLTPAFATSPPTGPPTSFTWQRRYDPMWMFGADLSKALGPVVLNAEAALKLGEDGRGTDPHVRNHRVEAVAGVVWSPLDDLSLGVQYALTALLGYDAAAESQALAGGGPPPPFVQEAVDHSVTLNVRADLTDTLHAQLTGVFSATYVDFFALAFVTWDLADAVSLSLGAVGFGGQDEHTPLAAQRANSRLFAEVKASF